MHQYDRSPFHHADNAYMPPGVFNQNQEAELTEQLLEVSSEQEFEQFLGDLIGKAGRAIGGFIKGPVGQALGGALKGVAGQVLPMAGQALGGMIGGPVGSQIGGQLASAAGSAFGLGEAEAAEQEYEAANTFVRLAADAVKNAAAAPPGANPHAVAHDAVAQAVQAHAPGIMPPEPGPGPGGPEAGGFGHGRSGRWIRRGGKIILFGA